MSESTNDDHTGGDGATDGIIHIKREGVPTGGGGGSSASYTKAVLHDPNEWGVTMNLKPLMSTDASFDIVAVTIKFVRECKIHERVDVEVAMCLANEIERLQARLYVYEGKQDEFLANFPDDDTGEPHE